MPLVLTIALAGFLAGVAAVLAVTGNDTGAVLAGIAAAALFTDASTRYRR